MVSPKWNFYVDIEVCLYSKLLVLLATVLAGAHTGAFAKVFRKERRIRKIEIVTDLAYSHIGRLQQYFCFEYNIILNPCAHSFSAYTLDDTRQMTGR